MVIRNHIGYRFLTDESFIWEIMGEVFRECDWKRIFVSHDHVLNEVDKLLKIKLGVYYMLINNQRQKPYLITDTVVDKIDLLKVNKIGIHYDWKVFKQLKNGLKITFLMPNNNLIRLITEQDTISMFHLNFEPIKRGDNNGRMYWASYTVDLKTGKGIKEIDGRESYFDSEKVLSLEEFTYKFMCFFFLSDNEEQIIPAGKVTGTRKTGKINNSFNFPITVVNSKWNVTVIRTDGFDVRGHFRLQPKGPGRSEVEMIFIEPYQKHGYIRHAKKESQTKL